MKKHIKVMLAAGFTAAMAVTTAFSQTNVLTVDEFGVGTYNGTPLASGPLFDPSSGITTIAYTLPFPAVPGDVVLSEPNIGTVSDVLRFDGNGNLFFFSDFDLSDPPDAPADKGLPSTYQLNTVFFTESGVEGGLQGLFGYAPGSGDPGDNSAGAIYNFISDVPEPGALPLLACGLGMLGYVQHRRKLARG